MADNKKPTHGVYHVEGEGERKYWTKVGAAWAHNDGDGFSISLNFIPTGTECRLVVRKSKPKQEGR